jgi:hypothetical protein
MTARSSARNALLVMLGCTACIASASHAAEVGASTDLASFAHNVSGSVTIVDENTFRVDDFVYDGGGPLVYFYLADEQSNAAFESGLRINPLLTGTPYDGSQEPLFFDLPVGETFDDYAAVSVWCAQFGVDFGSGTFIAPSPCPQDFDGDRTIGTDDFFALLQNWGTCPAEPDACPWDVAPEEGDGVVGVDDFFNLLQNWGSCD